jgi:hypothetical protein
MKITIQQYSEEIVVDVSDDIDVHDMLDVFIRLMLMVSYQKNSVDNAILERARQITET